VECYQKYAPLHRRKPDRLFAATAEWIFEDDYKWPFSFLNICDAVGIDAKYLRNGLQQWNETRSGKLNALKEHPAAPIKIRRCDRHSEIATCENSCHAMGPALRAA